MKKTLLLAAFAFAGAFAYAQKPSAGNVTTEIGLSSVLGTPTNPGTTINIPGGLLRGRYFLSDNMALRAQVGIGMGSLTEKYDNGNPTALKTSEDKYTSSNFGIAAGIEMHMEGTGNLSPYIGAEFGFGSSSSTLDVTGARGTGGNGIADGAYYKETGGGVTQLNFNALIGADYYIVDNVYIGGEMGIRLFGSSTMADSETETLSGSGGNVVKTKSLGATSSSFGLQPGVLAAIRIGIVLF